MYVAKIMKHRWEEEPISGIGKGFDGTFAIFFYGCNMRCIYCQNSKISRQHVSVDKKIVGSDTIRPHSGGELSELEKTSFTAEELSDKIIKAESENVASVSFITGVLYIDEIVETIKLAKSKGSKLPMVYNSSGYETVSQIKKLDGLIDIYLPDFKYFDNELGKKFSKVPNYADVAKACIGEMHRQIAEAKNFRSGELRGPLLIVRHLVLPNNTENSKQVIKYLYDTYGNDICLSIMSQYTPMLKNEGINEFPELMRKLTKREYDKVVDFAINLGIKNAYIQEGDVAEESFIPDF